LTQAIPQGLKPSLILWPVYGTDKSVPFQSNRKLRRYRIPQTEKSGLPLRDRPHCFALRKVGDALNAGGFGVFGVEFGDLDFAGQAEFAEDPDAPEVGIDLIPGEAVARADGWAWWLLCQPSPPVSRATHQLLRESSRVSKRRLPHMWVAELTSQVAWRRG